MAFFFNRMSIYSQYRSHFLKKEDSHSLPRRGFHIELGAREKALLAEDPSLKPFRSYKKSVSHLRRIGDVLTVAVVAGCCYEIYVKAAVREDVRKQAIAESSQ